MRHFPWFLLLAAASFAQTRQDVIHHLQQSIAWYRQISAAEQLPAVSGDVLLHDSTLQTATQALQLAFDFARAEAALMGNNTEAGVQGSNQNLERAQTRAADRVNGLQARIAALEQELAKAPAKRRAILEAQRNELGAELELARQVQQTIGTMLSFSGTTARGRTGLTGQIDELQRSFPESVHVTKPAGTATGKNAAAAPTAPPRAAVPTTQPFHPESAGILSLATEMFSINGARTQLRGLLRESDDLLTAIDRLRTPVVGEIRSAVARSEALANASDSEDPAQLAAGQKEIEALTARIRQLSTATIPLGEQAIAVQNCRGDLVEAHASVSRQYGSVSSYLGLRTGGMLLAIVVVLALSGLWSRVAFRYVRDQRRRRQFTVLRRVLVGAAIFVVVVLGFVTQFGSLATYAGLLTAGLAVALQNVILSVVAYFFLIGRYGIRIGDRVTISGVTGKVVDIGLVRIYLMEMTGSGLDLHATGRIVVYSNSVLFQPSALFKQMPGTDYVWHSVHLTLAPNIDYHVAEERITAAVNSVYEGYRESIERQHAALERSVEIEVANPRPETRMRFSPAGLEFTVHYPVEADKANEIDELVMKALYDAIAEPPRLPLANEGAPKLQEA